MRLRLGIDRLEAFEHGELFARYTFAGARRPYIWPLIGPAGHSVVRGAGGVDHPHHSGLGINYGGHSEGGSANIWSDWDEAPFGPGGRIVHRGWVELGDDWATEELVYVNATGQAIAAETRTLRFAWASATKRYIDLEVRLERVHDAGPRPFVVHARASDCFDIPRTGQAVTAAGRSGPADWYREHDEHRAAWIDLSGPCGGPPPPPPARPPDALLDIPGAALEEPGPGTGPWNGIALLDHPSNHGYPNLVGRYAVAQQLTQLHYPPPDAPDGPFAFRTRVYVHDGDAVAGEVAAETAAYARS